MQGLKTVHSSGGNSSASLYLCVPSLSSCCHFACLPPAAFPTLPTATSALPSLFLLLPNLPGPASAPRSASPPLGSFISLFPSLQLVHLTLSFLNPLCSLCSPLCPISILFFPGPQFFSQLSFNFKTFSEVLSVSLPLYLPPLLSLLPPLLFAGVILLTIPLFHAVFYRSCGPHLQTAAPAGKNKTPINSNSQLFA